MFTPENTRDYSQAELDALTGEWERIVREERLTPESDEYYQRQKQFADEVSRR